MEEQNKESIKKIAETLNRLAILKNQIRTPEQIMAMARYLSRYFDVKEISEACEYFLQRDAYMPGIDRFFAVLRPIKSLEQRTLDLYSEFETSLRASNGNYHYFIQNSRPELVKFVVDHTWAACQAMYKKDAIEILKTYLNNKEFYLDTIGALNGYKKIE